MKQEVNPHQDLNGVGGENKRIIESIKEASECLIGGWSQKVSNLKRGPGREHHEIPNEAQKGRNNSERNSNGLRVEQAVLGLRGPKAAIVKPQDVGAHDGQKKHENQSDDVERIKPGRRVDKHIFATGGSVEGGDFAETGRRRALGAACRVERGTLHNAARKRRPAHGHTPAPLSWRLVRRPTPERKKKRGEKRKRKHHQDASVANIVGDTAHYGS